METEATILVIDDDEIFRKLLSLRLETLGYEVIATGNSERGIDLAARYQPDLIVLDLFMPGMDGYETARILQAKKETRNIPFVILSAAEEEHFEKRSLDWGAQAHVSKNDVKSAIAEPVARLRKDKLDHCLLQNVIDGALSR